MRIRDLITHTEAEITAALTRGADVWHLDASDDDCSDFFIGPRELVVNEILARHCPETQMLPERWVLRRVDAVIWSALVDASG